jgi:TldD protein
MLEIEAASQLLAQVIAKTEADYIEARLEINQSSYLTYKGRELETVGRAKSLGGNIRVLVNGGWGFVTFNNLSDLRDNVSLAIKQAKMIGHEESVIVRGEPVVDTISGKGMKNPVEIPIQEKKELLDRYNGIMLDTPNIQTTSITYFDNHKRMFFINSMGSSIEQERADITLRLGAIATSGDDIQQASLSLGNTGDLKAMTVFDSDVAEISRRAVELLAAPQIEGGEYNIILDPVLAGVFIHEAFGHLSEADFVYENQRLRDLMVMGKKFGSDKLNVIDSGLLPGLRGSYRYDDEGIPATHTYLIREGRLVGRLHSRETAGKMNETPTGNARAINYQFPPIVRMTNTYIEAGNDSLDDMIGDIKEGIYAKNWYGGTTSMEMFTFSAGEAYMIRDGKIGELIRPVVLSGNVFDTLHNIVAIGDDIKMNQGGGCGKGGQMPLPVSNGSPHIWIRRCLVGGR